MRGHGTWEQLSADRPRCTRTMFLEVFKSRMPVPVPGSRNDRVAHLLYNRYAPPCQFLKTKSLLCSVAAHTFEIRLCRYELRCIILPGTSYQFEVCDYESNSLPAHSLNHTHILHPMWKDAKLRIVAHPNQVGFKFQHSTGTGKLSILFDASHRSSSERRASQRRAATRTRLPLCLIDWRGRRTHACLAERE